MPEWSEIFDVTLKAFYIAFAVIFLVVLVWGAWTVMRAAAREIKKGL